MDNVIDFKARAASSEPAQTNDSDLGQYITQLEHEILDLKNALADMAVSLFQCRLRLGEATA